MKEQKVVSARWAAAEIAKLKEEVRGTTKMWREATDKNYELREELRETKDSKNSIQAYWGKALTQIDLLTKMLAKAQGVS